MALIVLQGKQTQEIEPQSLPIGTNSQEVIVRQWLGEHFNHPFSSTSLKTSIHLRSVKAGLELEFDKGLLSTIFVYFRAHKMQCFEGVVKYGINRGWSIKGAVSYLGEPPVKNPKLLEIIYPHLGIGLVFQGTWSNQLSLIDYCYLYAGEGGWHCAGCGRQSKESVFSCDCELVRYCSAKCYKRHYGHHLIFCEVGSPK